MYKSKAIISILILAAIAVFVVAAVLPALKGGSEGYQTRTAPAAEVTQQQVETTEAATAAPAIEEQVTAVVEQASESVTDVVDQTAEVVTETAEDAAAVVADVVEDVTETVSQQPVAAATGGLYSVVDGNKLDAKSYNGFKLFRNWCARCHGTYGQGMAGPNLAESLNIISKEEFFNTVENGKSGTIGSMPAWSSNPQVMDGRDDLYAYLKARADGAIGEVKPAKQ